MNARHCHLRPILSSISSGTVKQSLLLEPVTRAVAFLCMLPSHDLKLQATSLFGRKAFLANLLGVLLRCSQR